MTERSRWWMLIGLCLLVACSGCGRRPKCPPMPANYVPAAKDETYGGLYLAVPMEVLREMPDKLRGIKEGTALKDAIEQMGLAEYVKIPDFSESSLPKSPWVVNLRADHLLIVFVDTMDGAKPLYGGAGLGGDGWTVFCDTNFFLPATASN